METFLWIALVNWGGPLLFLVYPLIMTLVFHDFKFEGFYGPFMKFRLLHRCETPEGDPIEPWHAKFWKGWFGVCLHFFTCYRDYPGKWDDEKVARGLRHECFGHGIAQLILGLLFWPLYLGHVFLIFTFQKLRYKWIQLTWKKKTRHGEKGYSKSTRTGYRFWLVAEPYTQHAYLDCWAERLARKVAGQKVDLDPDEWPHGKDDLWPWF